MCVLHYLEAGKSYRESVLICKMGAFIIYGQVGGGGGGSFFLPIDFAKPPPAISAETMGH